VEGHTNIIPPKKHIWGYFWPKRGIMKGKSVLAEKQLNHPYYWGHRGFFSHHLLEFTYSYHYEQSDTIIKQLNKSRRFMVMLSVGDYCSVDVPV